MNNIPPVPPSKLEIALGSLLAFGAACMAALLLGILLCLVLLPCHLLFGLE